ncbi:Maf family protein [Aquirufa sp. ROCK2-A2]
MQNNLTLQFPLILASNSPRRKEILSQAGFEFTILPSDIDESFPDDMPAQEVPKMLAEKKAQVLSASVNNQLVLAADTVVIIDGKILNKPMDKSEARQMLLDLSGRTHQVITGIALAGPHGLYSTIDESLVTFKKLVDWEIDFYVRGGSGLDKAGAYGVQDFIGMVGIEEIKGSYYTVMGLPIFQVYQYLLPYILESKQGVLEM